MKFGYVRISTKDQKFDLQYDALLKEGVAMKNIYKDVASGVREERKGLDRLLLKLRDGDTLVVWKLDRIARSVIHLAKLMQYFDSEGIQFKSFQEPFLDTTSSHGKFIFTLFSAVAQLERDLIIDRTKAGLEAAAKRGRKGGRRPGLTKEAKRKARMCKLMYKDHTIRVVDICETIGLSKKTFYKYLQMEVVKIGVYKKKSRR